MPILETTKLDVIMEVVGIVASITAIVSAAKGGLKLARYLREKAHGLDAARDDIEAYASNLEAFNELTLLAYNQISVYCQAENSKLLPAMAEANAFERLGSQGDCVNRLVKQVTRRLGSLKSRWKIVEEIKWLLRKPEIMTLHPHMEAIKSSLSLFLHLIQLETLQNSGKVDRNPVA